jgi:hypothetical protein
LLNAIHRIPLSVPEASRNHPFAQFSGELKGCIPEGEDSWETWDGPLNTILQKELQELEMLVTRGHYGISALHCFLQYLVTEHAVDSALFEGKIERLICAMNNIRSQCVESEKHIEPDAHDTSTNGPISNAGGTVIDLTIDRESESASNSGIISGHHNAMHKNGESRDHVHHCPGYCIDLSACKSPHTAYPAR